MAGQITRWPALLTHVVAGLCVGVVLIAVGQPIMAEDTWWHLAMGQIHLTDGLWLERDPFLFAAESGPAPAAWLFGVALHSVERLTGLHGLRVLNVVLALAILSLAWITLRRESRSASYASLATATFASLAAYRLFQIRPHLITILATLIVIAMISSPRVQATARRLLGVAVLYVLWANAHGAFVLGLVLIGAALAGTLLGGWLWTRQRTRMLKNARALGLILLVASLASVLNPSGIEQHLLYFSAGIDTPELGVVVDEWRRFPLLSGPSASAPPTPLVWVIVWALLLLAPLSAVIGLARVRESENGGGTTEHADADFALPVDAPGDAPGDVPGDVPEEVPTDASEPVRRDVSIDALTERRLNPALLAMCAVSLIAMLSAVRLSWLGILPMLLVGQIWGAFPRTTPSASVALRWLAPILATLLLIAFVRYGDWPMISRGITPTRYTQAYPAVKYSAHAVWFLVDSGVRGRLWNEYSLGNFLSAWVAPNLQLMVNGSLNVPGEVMRAATSIAAGRGANPGDDLNDELDRYAIDVFLGTGIPTVPYSGRSLPNSTAHLERTAGWVLAYRGARGAVYVRREDSEGSNLQRVSDYYLTQGVPFDSSVGFDVERVIREAPDWAAEHGISPTHLNQLEASARSFDPHVRRSTQHRLAATWAALGLYERDIALERRILIAEPESVQALRRLVWSLLHLDRSEEAAEAASRLAALADEEDWLSHAVAEAGRLRPLSSPVEARERLATLPLFYRREMGRVVSSLEEPEARPRAH